MDGCDVARERKGDTYGSPWLAQGMAGLEWLHLELLQHGYMDAVNANAEDFCSERKVRCVFPSRLQQHCR